MLLVPAALALSILSIAYLLSAPLALTVAIVVFAWSACADIECAIVVSRRARTGRKGQQTIASVRLTPRRAVRAVVETARGAGARTLADIGAAVLTVGAVCAAPWAMLAAPDGVSAATAAGAALALAHHMARTAGLRYRADG